VLICSNRWASFLAGAQEHGHRLLSRSVHRSGRAIDLGPKEFSLLEFLIRHSGHPVGRATIVEQVWRLNLETMTNVVDVYVN